MNEHRIEQLARKAGMVQGPWSNSKAERIWQENRDFPDALELFAALIAQECVNLILQDYLGDGYEVYEAANLIREHFKLDEVKETL